MEFFSFFKIDVYIKQINDIISAGDFGYIYIYIQNFFKYVVINICRSYVGTYKCNNLTHLRVRHFILYENVSNII